MGFNFENQHFTPEPHEALASQVIKHAFEMQPGEILYTEFDNVLIDRTLARTTWIYRHAAVLSAEEVIDVCLDAYDEGDDREEYVRVIMTEEGIIVDQSHEEKKDWSNPNDKYNREEQEYFEHHPEMFMPVIHRIHNTEELELVSEALASTNNIVLDGVQNVSELMEAVDDHILQENGIDVDIDIDGFGNAETDESS